MVVNVVLHLLDSICLIFVQEKLSLAHKTLAADSNSRVIARVEEIKSQKLEEQEKKKQVIAQKQLASLNAVKILQKKRLQNLRKKVAPLQSSSSGGTFDKLPSLLPGNNKSPLLQLSNNEKTQVPLNCILICRTKTYKPFTVNSTI